MSTELATITAQDPALSLQSRITDPLDYIQKMGIAIAKSGLLGCKTDAQGQVLMLASLTEGKSPIQIHREYHIMPDGLSMRADTMLAKFLALGGKHRVIQRDPEGAIIELTIDGQTQRFGFSWKEALNEKFVYARDGKLKDNYATPRSRMQMMWARVVSDSVRTMAPGVVSGIYTPEEVQDFNSNGQVPEEPKPGPAAKSKAQTQAAVAAAPAPATAPTSPPAAVDPAIIDAEYVVETKPQPAAATTSAPQAAPQPTAEVPFDPAQEPAAGEAAGSLATKALMEIELVLPQLGMTKEALIKTLNAKNPAITSLDSLDEENMTKLLTNLRNMLAKKREAAAA